MHIYRFQDAQLYELIKECPNLYKDQSRPKGGINRILVYKYMDYRYRALSYKITNTQKTSDQLLYNWRFKFSFKLTIH